MRLGIQERIETFQKEEGAIGLQDMLAIVLLVFIVFIVGINILNGTALDPDSSDGGTQYNLTNIGLVLLSAVVIIAGMVRVVLNLLT